MQKIVKGGENMKKHNLKITTLLFSLILVLCLAPAYAVDSTDPQWPQSSYNSEQNGQSPYTGPEHNNSPEWNFTLKSDGQTEPASSPVVDSEGNVYFVGAYFPPNPEDAETYLYKINPNGTSKFNISIAKWLGGCSIGPDGTLYIPGHNYGDDNYLFARNPAGTTKGTVTVSDVWNLMNPVVTGDGTIYFGTPQNRNAIEIPTHGIYWALNPDGTEKWNFYIGINEPGPKVPNNLLGYAVNSAGTSYLGFSEGVIEASTENRPLPRQTAIYALDVDGNQKWKTVLDIPGAEALSLFSLAVGPNGIIYAVVSAGNLLEDNAEPLSEDPPLINKDYVFAINPDGSQAWRYDVPGESELNEKATSSLAVANDGTIYFGTVVGGYVVGNGTLFALNPDGTQKWNYTSSNDFPFSTPIIDSDGIIYTSNSVPFIGGDGEGQAAGAPEETVLQSEPIARFFAFNPDGTVKWAVDNIISSYPAALTKNGTIYISGIIPGGPMPPPLEGYAAGEPITAPYANSLPEAVLYQLKGSVSNLYLQVTSSNNNPTVGDLITLTFKVGNKAQDSALGTVFKWVLPDGLEIVGNPWSDTINQPVYDPTTRTITWDLGTVPYGDPYMWVNTRILAAGSLIIQATLNTLTNDPELEQNLQILTINAQSINQESKVVNSANTQSVTNTVGMQNTGVPIAVLVLTIIVILGGILTEKRK
jgi:uncharacterized repeat protein (TIGR01451 family)